MTILFLHGWHSVPGGVKPTYLKDHGHEVVNPALDDDDFAAAVRTAQAEFDQHRPQVVVGSSRGGAVAMNIASGGAKLVLLCPAWKKWGTVTTVKRGTVILHSRADDVIPFADSEELAKSSGATLIEVGNDHRLADPEPLAAMLRACENPTLAVIGVDPASSKGLMIWDGKDASHVPANRAVDWMASLTTDYQGALICWDSPLSFDPEFGLSDRPVEKVLRAAVGQWVGEGRIAKKAVSVLPFSGCSHWVISCDAVGLPFTRENRNAFPLAPAPESVRTGGVWLLEAHPAVALAIWWLEGGPRSIPLPVYKKNRSACHLIAETLGFNELLSFHALNDDILDAYVAHRLGILFMTGQSIWIGEPRSGGFVLPVSAETKWQLGSKVKQMSSKTPQKAKQVRVLPRS
jgi:pimeloyl-ACP methyl ester carboxylesterase